MIVTGLILLLLLALPAGAPVIGEEAAGLKVGDECPAFSLEGSDGKPHSLKNHVGNQPMVIAWFPKAFTSG